MSSITIPYYTDGMKKIRDYIFKNGSLESADRLNHLDPITKAAYLVTNRTSLLFVEDVQAENVELDAILIENAKTINAISFHSDPLGDEQ